MMMIKIALIVAVTMTTTSAHIFKSVLGVSPIVSPTIVTPTVSLGSVGIIRPMYSQVGVGVSGMGLGVGGMGMGGGLYSGYGMGVPMGMGMGMGMGMPMGGMGMGMPMGGMGMGMGGMGMGMGMGMYIKAIILVPSVLTM